MHWNDALIVGNVLIDTQHRAFFDEVNAVVDALARGAPHSVVQRFHRNFVIALVRHFRDEELLLARVNYPDLEHHQAEHRALMASVTALAESLGLAESFSELMVVVRNTITTLIEHMALEDMRYRRYVSAAQAESW
ncbi:bacteriohemerythrin [Magnetospirillum sulfuroxidans]|uniref:Hemerythrin domain-containing protein n=1 Tax=Magnetospirillum sulfuroxidans TaxID=611300 RepID=A0ABS5IH06_9PROT|nr:hemerythrin domain-containing protein [Magnetospirillum sulfuroxidans]MBR9973028.1 hemerythrin domain-containing protein [Magnetospirillum sulfuroxidans]